MSTTSAAKRPGSMGRQLAWYFGGLIAAYAACLVAFWPAEGEEPSAALLLCLAYAPLVGALLARFFGGGRIQWGRPNWWILVSLVPTVAVLGVYLIGSALGEITLDTGALTSALLFSPIAIVLASLSASVGEEPGWRGFLWPLLRERWGFLVTSLVVAIIWWAFHVPVILLGWYGTLGGLPAFTVALVGFTLFVGVITDRSRAVWPAIVAHGAWNGLAANGFAGNDTPAFTGSEQLVGEFGWLAAVASLVVGVVATVWHMRTMGGPIPAPDAAAVPSGTTAAAAPGGGVSG